MTLTEIIDFLVGLLSDDNARAEFEQDPQGALEQAGLAGVSGQDVRDARLQLADDGAVRATDDGSGSSYPGGDDPVQEINYTTRHYAVDSDLAVDRDGYDVSFVDQSTTVVTIDDRDTILVNDAFNTDNSTTDIDVVAIDAENSFNEEDNDVTAIQADNSFNTDEDNDVTAIQDNDTVNVENDILVAENSFNDGVPADETSDESPEEPTDQAADEPDAVDAVVG